MEDEIKINNHVMVILANARDNNIQALTREKNDCPKNIKIQVFAKAIVCCARDKGKKAPNTFNTVINVCLGNDDDLKKRVFHRALALCAENEYKEALEKLKDICPNNLKKIVFARAMFCCAAENNKNALNIVKDACPDTLKAGVLYEAQYVCEQEDNEEARLMIEEIIEDFNMTVPLNRGRASSESNTRRRGSTSRGTHRINIT